MIYDLENDFLKLGINSVGAEMTYVNSTQTGKQFLWDGNPDIWAGHAPILFPIVGGLKENSYFYNDQKYQLPRHGFVRHNDKLTLLSNNAQQITLQLVSDETSLQVYPFPFNFQIQYKLSQNRIDIHHHVTNMGEADMYFSLGGHPAFNLPIDKNTKYADYFLEFEFPENESTYLLSAAGLVQNQTKPMLTNSRKLVLDEHIFDGDALIFKHLKSRKVVIKSLASTTQIEVAYPDFPYLGIWSKPGAPFVCIEPWLGIADLEDTDMQLQNKAGILLLKPKQVFSASYSITITE
jgi:galactose mutarotase-like enzyme